MADRHNLGYMLSMSSLSASTSSPSTADVSPLLDSVLTLSTASTSSMHHRRAPRRSLSMLGKLPKDFSSLLRSHSSSRRESTAFQTDQSAKVLLTDYADSHHPYDQPTTKKVMYASRDDERPTRKQKPENRFYNFLTRSRSRSRTKADSSIEPEGHFPELSHDFHEQISHSRQSSVSKREEKAFSKHSSHLSTRPLSSTTTATNTTITPHTPKARRIVPIPVPEQPHNENTSRPPTPKGISNTRRKLHNIFGIPLSGPHRSGSRKSSVSSTRPGTPDPQGASNPPPLPGPSSQDFQPERSPRRPRAPPPSHTQRSERPSLTTRSTSGSTESLTSSMSKRENASRIQKHFIARTANFSSPSSSFDDRSNLSSIIVSGPTRHRRTHTSDSLPSAPITPTSPNHRTSHIATPQPRHIADSHNVLGIIPKITHTAATPQRPVTTPPRISYRKNSLDSSHPHREMSVVDEERSVMESEMERGKGRDSDATFQGSHFAIPKVKSGNKRSTRHGSFDFERPGWGIPSLMARTLSNNSASTGASGPNKSGDSLSHADASSKTPPLDVPKRRRSQRKPPIPIQPLEPDHTGASTSTTHSRSTSGNNGQSNSFGRSTGKRALGSGVAKLVSVPHGTFSFEPPVPSPTISSSTHGSGLSDYERDGEERERERAERRRRQTREDARRHAPSPDLRPAPTSLGFRSAEKGRSLDLGLGLSWVPSKVREDALMPSSMFPLDRRSKSASSRIGMRRGFMDEEDDTRVGKDIAEKFKSALDPAGYTVFKQYVHRFDAQEIPLEGPTGIIARAERLLDKSSNLTDDRKRRLIDNFVRIILHNA